MGKATGFLEYERKTNPAISPAERIQNFNEFHPMMMKEERQEQGARCMNCGVPFCQSAMTLHGAVSGCPLHNLIPEWNDEIYHGNWSHALARLLKTSSFPEFTGRVCPALCEAACTCGMYDDPVTVKENELFVIEYGFQKGFVQPQPPAVRTDKRVAVVGSGPSGLACADRLNKRGHQVTVFEKEDRPGGLLMYGIPNMKLEKWVVQRRVELMEAEGVRFVTGKDIRTAKDARGLMKEYDAVVLCCGAGRPRDLKVPGRDGAKGVHFAVDFLKSTTKALLDEAEAAAAAGAGTPAERTAAAGTSSGTGGTKAGMAAAAGTSSEKAGTAAAAGSSSEKAGTAADRAFGDIQLAGRIPAKPDLSACISAAGKRVVVVGGGDTGNDCVGTAIRHGCKSVVQLEMMPKPPTERREDNQWPQWPKVLKVDYGQEEAMDQFGADPRIYQTTVKAILTDESGQIRALQTVKLEPSTDEKTGRTVMKEIAGSESEMECDLLLIAAGFLGPQEYVAKAFGVKTDGRSNLQAPDEKAAAGAACGGNGPAACGGGEDGRPARQAGPFATSAAGVFAAGAARRGQSLVVWAIAEGRACAKAVDEYLMDYTNLL
ncbi:MAG: glutamate synthase subunit beta [Anaerovoracaceae bacterium]|nr:glutamate synthase subunit beta [Anaerovoracaceae bacterium]